MWCGARGVSRSPLVGVRMRGFAASRGVSGRLAPEAASIRPRVRSHYEWEAQAIDLTAGLSMEVGAWRFNLRGSNTEPLVRLNVEARASVELMREKTAEVLKLVDG